MKRIAILIFFIVALIFSCKQKNSSEYFVVSQIDSLIFGRYYGNAVCDYSLVFKYTKGKMYVDSSDSYYLKEAESNFSNYTWVNINNLDTNLVGQAISFIPRDYSGIDTTFGNPDNLDQGGCFVIIFEGNRITKIDLDNFENKIPNDFVPVSNSFREAIDSLAKWNSVK